MSIFSKTDEYDLCLRPSNNPVTGKSQKFICSIERIYTNRCGPNAIYWQSR